MIRRDAGDTRARDLVLSYLARCTETAVDDQRREPSVQAILGCRTGISHEYRVILYIMYGISAERKCDAHNTLNIYEFKMIR
jgi:hypothetical protein